MSVTMDPILQVAPATTPSQPIESGPVPMSFPSILRNPGVSRFVTQRINTHDSAGIPVPTVRKKNRRDEKEGKRWIRRDENSRFAHNPHAVMATRKDYSLPVPSVHSTFPRPLPAYLQRNTPIPAALPRLQQPLSANAGRFSLSLKGMRRELRGSGPANEILVRELESSLLSWLADGGVMLSPDVAQTFEFPGASVDSMERVKEVQRTPLQLVWDVDDNFTRYIVHCCARYHEIVSFSKDTSGHRLTHILRPNVTRPDPRAINSLATPPITDLSASELSLNERDLTTTTDGDTDFVSDRGGLSDVAELSDVDAADRLSAVAESDQSRLGSPAFAIERLRSDDEWSIVHEADIEVDSESEAGDGDKLADSVNSLSIISDAESAVGDLDRTPRPPASRRALDRTGPWTRQDRSNSSPSRSPARRAPPRRGKVRNGKVSAVQLKKGKTFHEYLFA